MDSKENIFKQVLDLYNNNDCEKAIDVALRGYKSYKDTYFLSQIAQIYINIGQRKDAIKYYKKIYKSEQDNVSNIKKLAYSLFYIGNYKEALEYYKLVLNFEPDVSENYFNVANMYHFMNKKEKAEDYYKFSIKLNPNNVSSINNLGLLYYENRRYEEALPYFKGAIKVSPNHPEAYHHIGVVNREYYKDYEMSKWYLKKALLLDPEYLLNSYQLGLTYVALNDKENAKERFEKCLKLEPSHKEAKKQLEALK